MRTKVCVDGEWLAGAECSSSGGSNGALREMLSRVGRVEGARREVVVVLGGWVLAAVVVLKEAVTMVTPHTRF